MEPKTNRLPVFIPAEMKKTKQQPATKVLSPATRRTISRFKQGIVSGAVIAFLFLTAFSFGSANPGKPFIPLFGNAIQQSQGQGSNSAFSQSQTGSQTQPVVAAPAMPNIPQNDLVTLAQQDAIKYGISPVYFVRQIYAESGFNPNAYSPAGAIGIAQFIPSTAAALGVNPYDPVSSLDGAARYMATLSNSFGGDYAKALAGYNAGSATVNNAVRNGGANWLSLMPLETQNYVFKIMG
jgi:soluble lytic murein transglycosylase-like protein